MNILPAKKKLISSPSQTVRQAKFTYCSVGIACKKNRPRKLEVKEETNKRN